jgi:two-component system phosphate regulon response regulator PhoB
VMLLDVMMPGELDGLQVCRSVRADPRLSGMRVLLLSARGQARDREAGAQAGADEYLIKPFSPLQLVETIERLLPSE